MAKSNKIKTTPSVTGVRDPELDMFIERAEKWASANSQTQEAASEKLKSMGIYDSSGKLAKNYR